MKNNIQDAGMVLTGARKHMYSGFSSLLETEFSEYGEYTKAKYLPKLNPVKMMDDGVESHVLLAIIAATNSIPRKPSGRKARVWNVDFARLMMFLQDVMSGSYSNIDQVLEVAKDVDTFFAFESRLRTANMIGVDDAMNMGLSVIVRNSGPYNGGVTYAHVNVAGRYGQFYSDLEDAVAALRKDIEANASNAKPTAKRKKYKFSVYESRKTKELYIGWRGKGSDAVKVVPNLESAQQGFDMIKDDFDGLVSIFESMQPDNDYWHVDALERVGPEWTDDGLITPDILVDRFGLRGVQYGNYVTQKERIVSNLRAYNGMSDLADILKVPFSAIGYNGSLGLAFGARGKGGARGFAAHFEPGSFNINLTRSKGVGSFAHEFGHSVAASLHVIGTSVPEGLYRASGDATEAKSLPYLSDEVSQAFSSLMNELLSTGLKERSAKLDVFRSTPYWSTKPEMFARAFERFIAYELSLSSRSNGWLVSINKSKEDLYEDYPYPTEAEMVSGLAVRFRALFDALVNHSDIFRRSDGFRSSKVA